MSEPNPPKPSESNQFSTSEPPLFHASSHPAENDSPITGQVWLAAGLVLLIVVVVFFLAGHENKTSGSTGYNNNVAISNILMSEADIPAGGKETYIDGTLKNNGKKTITALTVHVIFANNMGQPPQVETQAIQLIRSREPYIDTVPVGTSPVQPGQSRDFRVIFEQVTPNWNQVTPVVQVVSVEAK